MTVTPPVAILKQDTDVEAQIEARLVETPASYAVGVIDLDAERYYPGLRVYAKRLDGALEKAIDHYNNITRRTAAGL